MAENYRKIPLALTFLKNFPGMADDYLFKSTEWVSKLDEKEKQKEYGEPVV